MSVRERDPLTGHATTGHEWDGITELNTRVPRAIWWFIGITHLWALIYWILMPSWPLVTTYTKGLLGYDEQEQVERQVVEAQLERSAWSRAIEEMPIEQIRADPALMRVVDETAPALFGDNCAVCHGADAAGGPGFPSLVDDAWLWGGDADTILETLRVGINAGASRYPDGADAGLRARRRPDPRRHSHAGRLRPVAERRRRTGGGARGWGAAVRRQLRELPWRATAAGPPSSALPT